MAYIRVLGIDPVPFARPGKLIIRASCREAVVADSDDLPVWADDAGTDLRVGIL